MAALTEAFETADAGIGAQLAGESWRVVGL
jgi:hypothetical protein